jgi:hypothetical protein
MWSAGKAVCWSCQANVHVYSLQLAPFFWVGPHQVSLTWVKRPLEGSPRLWLHLQVRAVDAGVRLTDLEIDGRAWRPGDPA